MEDIAIYFSLSVVKGTSIDDLFGFEDMLKRITLTKYRKHVMSGNASDTHHTLIAISKAYISTIFEVRWRSVSGDFSGLVYYWNGESISTANLLELPDLKQLPGLMQDYPELLL